MRIDNSVSFSVCLGFLVLLSQGCVAVPPSPADITIVNARLYVEPGTAPIDAANLSISNGRISNISIGAPPDSKVIFDAKGRVVTAGLWNSHIHLTSPKLAQDRERIVRDMFLKYGFTTVIDTGSDLQDTLALISRIEGGGLLGPRILTANGSFVYLDGTPSYLPGIKLPESEYPEAAGQLVDSVLDSGADGIKIFSGSYQAQRDTIHLPPDVIQAIADAAHFRDSFVMAHPTDRTGFINAVENGVDVLAHTAPQAGPLGPDLVEIMKSNNVAIIPTLKLWKYELERAGVPRDQVLAFQNIGVRQLAEYFHASGEVIFGTDVGFIDDFDTAQEFQLMSEAGMGFNDILASMTTIPSQRFLNEPGKLIEGAPADLVIFHDDPSLDATAFSRVAVTIRAGHVVYSDEIGAIAKSPLASGANIKEENNGRGSLDREQVPRPQN